MIIIFYKETSYRYGLIFYIKKKTGIWEAPVLDLILSDLANVRVFAESPLDKSHLRNSLYRNTQKSTALATPATMWTMAILAPISIVPAFKSCWKIWIWDM